MQSVNSLSILQLGSQVHLLFPILWMVMASLRLELRLLPHIQLLLCATQRNYFLLESEVAPA